MTKPYNPQGKILKLLAAMDAEPDRVFTIPEAGKVMNIRAGQVMAAATRALRNGFMYRGLVDGRAVLSKKPFATGGLEPPESRKRKSRVKIAKEWNTATDDVRAPKVVPGWVPPKMVPPRACNADSRNSRDLHGDRALREYTRANANHSHHKAQP